MTLTPLLHLEDSIILPPKTFCYLRYRIWLKNVLHSGWKGCHCWTASTLSPFLFLSLLPQWTDWGAGDATKPRTTVHCFLGNRHIPGEWTVTAWALVLVSFSRIFLRTELFCTLTYEFPCFFFSVSLHTGRGGEVTKWHRRQVAQRDRGVSLLFTNYVEAILSYVL